MKRLLLPLLCFLCLAYISSSYSNASYYYAAPIVAAGPSYEGGGENEVASPSNPSVSYSSSSGNLLVCGCYSYSNSATFAISDNESQSWTAYTRQASANAALQMFYKENSAAVTSVTCTVTDGGGTSRLVVGEFSGIATSSSLEDGASATGTNSSFGSGNFTVTTGDLIVGAAFGNTLVAGTGYTSPAETNLGWVAMEYQVIDGTTANATWTASWAEYIAIGAGFLPE